ncbi:Bcr/CflA family efflux MFS transporter [Bacillus sp. JCM 19041]|uniref:Bcr/CflA family efflux MFS transporter n=1 Tax=Bacillus sp. JCM 19041 TaxID=1460637 RepID=UPI000B327AFF
MESTRTEPRPVHSGSRLWLAIMLGSLAAFGSLTVDMYLPSFPAIAENFQTNASLVQLSLTAALLGLACGQLIIGPISDARGRKKPLVFFLFLYIAASLLCFFAPSIWVFIVARFLQGFSASASVVIARAIARDLYSGKSLTQFFSMLMVMTGLSPILAPVIGSTILEATGWRSVFAVLALITVVMVVIVCVTFEESLPESRRSKNNLKQTVLTFGDLVKERVFFGIALAQGFVMAGAFAFVAGSPFFVPDVLWRHT